jgi:hypothetical protein
MTQLRHYRPKSVSEASEQTFFGTRFISCLKKRVSYRWFFDETAAEPLFCTGTMRQLARYHQLLVCGARFVKMMAKYNGEETE